MSQLERRLERLEQRTGITGGPRRLIYLTPNLEDADGEETPCYFRISSEVWATVVGGPFTAEEIRNLRKEYNEDRNRNEPETKN